MPSAPLHNRLMPEVAAHRLGSYSVAADLERLGDVRAVGASEATIFYSARMLEALVMAAVQCTGVAASASAYSNLEMLMQFNLIPTATLHWANGLRRLGNDVRHLLRRTEAQDADLAVLFAERCIEWYFCQFRFGPRLASVTRDGAPAVGEENSLLQGLMRAIDAEDFDPLSLATAHLEPGRATVHGRRNARRRDGGAAAGSR